MISNNNNDDDNPRSTPTSACSDSASPSSPEWDPSNEKDLHDFPEEAHPLLHPEEESPVHLEDGSYSCSEAPPSTKKHKRRQHFAVSGVLVAFNSISSILMASTFTCLSYSMDLQTPSPVMLSITSPFLSFLDPDFQPIQNTITSISFALATTVFVGTTLGWLLNDGMAEPIMCCVLMAMGVIWIKPGFNAVEIILVVLPLCVSFMAGVNCFIGRMLRVHNLMDEYLLGVERHKAAMEILRA